MTVPRVKFRISELRDIIEECEARAHDDFVSVRTEYEDQSIDFYFYESENQTATLIFEGSNWYKVGGTASIS